MTSDTIPHKNIVSQAKGPLKNIQETATMYSEDTNAIFSKLGARVGLLSKAVTDASSSINRFPVDATKIMGRHPKPPPGGATEGLAKSTSARHELDPLSLISSEPKVKK